jgi:organic radical activating enzyme
MNDKARIIVTLNCQRMCEYCCNKHDSIKNAWNEELLIDILSQNQYREYIITGGEPLLNWERTRYIIEQIREYHFNQKGMGGNFYPKIRLYTSLVIDEMADVLGVVDGLTFSLHQPVFDGDLRAFKKLQTLVEFFDDKSCYLNIESYIDRELPINPSVWRRVQTFKPLDNCPVPEGETLFRLMEVW